MSGMQLICDPATINEDEIEEYLTLIDAVEEALEKEGVGYNPEVREKAFRAKMGAHGLELAKKLSLGVRP